MRGFTNFLLSQDRLGHRFSLLYRGKDSHQTWLGTTFTMAINILVLIVFITKTVELVMMTDPEVQSQARFFLKDEIEEAGQIDLSDHKMQIGFLPVRLDTQS